MNHPVRPAPFKGMEYGKSPEASKPLKPSEMKAKKLSAMAVSTESPVG